MDEWLDEYMDGWLCEGGRMFDGWMSGREGAWEGCGRVFDGLVVSVWERGCLVDRL